MPNKQYRYFEKKWKQVEKALFSLGSTAENLYLCHLYHGAGHKKNQFELEISALTKQRDKPLPLLMNGQVMKYSDLELYKYG